jgi:hypothetical protein
VYGSFWDNVCIEAVAEVDRINIVARYNIISATSLPQIDSCICRQRIQGGAQTGFDIPFQIAVHYGEEDL